MYTVLRFFGDEDRMPLLGNKLNALAPSMYKGPDRIGGRFSCEISESDNWEDHCSALQQNLGLLDDVLAEARSLGFALQVDTAIEPEDYYSRWITEVSIDLNLIRMLEASQIGLVFTVYGQGDE